MSVEQPRIPFGSYELVSKIAHGGMAEVFLACRRGEDGGPEEQIVLKRILPELGRDSRFLAMFINEAQLAAQMDHRNVVKVHDFGELDGQAFMVMEHVEGLDCWRFSRRLFPWGDDHEAVAVRVVMESLEGLEYVHRLTDVNGVRLNVVHRDFSPSNIYLSVKGEVKLGDFGIAQIESSRFRPIDFIAKGKFGYMAPEQVEGRGVDRRADVYSAGVVLSELLIGRKLFSGNSRLSVMLNIRDGRMDALENNTERISPGVMEIIRGALAKRPSERYQTAAEFRERLGEFLIREGREISLERIGRLVRKAVILREPRSSAPDFVPEATPITETQTVTEVNLEPEVTYRHGGLEHPSPDNGTPVTVESENMRADGRYLAHMKDGLTIGPTSYAHIIELIYSDRITHDTEISIDGHRFVRASDLPELARHLPAFTPTCDVDDVSTPDRRGYLEMETPSEVLITLAMREDSGLFVCQRGQRRKEVFIKRGRPVYVGSNDSSELLGEFLVEKGVIDRMELEMALALLPKFNGHMGDTLIALGMLSAVDLFAHIQAQITGRLEDLLRWRSGSYEFYSGAQSRPGVLEISIDPYAFVCERLLAAVQDLDVADVLEKMSRTMVAPSPRMDAILERLTLPSEILDQVRSVTDWLTVGELATAAGRRKTILARSIYIALETGIWTIDGPPPPWLPPVSDTPEE